jgi:hypothetical protein
MVLFLLKTSGNLLCMCYQPSMVSFVLAIKKFSTAAYPSGSTSLFGISALVILSTWSGSGYSYCFSSLSRNITMWACGRPLFWNSIVYITAIKTVVVS